MTDQEIIRAVEGHCHDGLNVAQDRMKGPLFRVGYLAKCLETILWECGLRDAETNAEDETVPLEHPHGNCAQAAVDGLATVMTPDELADVRRRVQYCEMSIPVSAVRK